MARLPKDPAGAVEALDLPNEGTVVLVGPDHGYLEACAEGRGDATLIVESPPPDADVPKSVEVVEEVAADVGARAIVVWLTVVPLHTARDLTERLTDDGVLWMVIPKAGPQSRASVTEGDVKRTMLAAGFRQDRVEQLSKDAFAVGFRRRR